MADIQLTPAQEAAVTDRDGALLVSAAAGSGKTKVLVDRLMAQICDPVRPRNINDYLIITYTKAAASELRAKISGELGKRLALDPTNRHLQRQLSLVYLTEISTVHAFCSTLLRTYAHLLDLPSDFRVVEEAQGRQLRDRAMETVLEQAYTDAKTDANCRAAIDQLGAGRDDRSLRSAIDAIYDAALCHTDPEDWLCRSEAALTIDPKKGCASTLWGGYLLRQFQTFLQAQIAAFQDAIAQMYGDEKLEKSYLPCFTANLQQLQALVGIGDWQTLSQSIPTSFGRLSAVRGYDDAATLARLKAVRSRCLDGLKEWHGIFDEESVVLADLMTASAALKGAVALTRQLWKQFTQEKRRRRMMDFSDLEHETIRLLVDRHTGGPTAVAKEIAGRFAEILVDEYQDSNAIQECIFSAISQNNRNRFMVGDVKQSIYRFRLADPSIFLEKYRAYAPKAQAEPGTPRKVLLSENFRSRPEILEAVNDVFRCVMSEEVGDLTYGPEESLKPGRKFPPVTEPPVELHCLYGVNADGESDKSGVEAHFVAQRISQLLQTGTVQEGEGWRSVRPEDIVILLRSVSSAAPAYLAAMQALGIPCTCDKGENLLETQEVETLMAILRVIDNPLQDIPLVTALASPVFSFTASQLAAIRSAKRKGSFYEALCAAAEQMEPAHAFLETLEELRRQAQWLPLHSLLRLVMERTAIKAVFGAMDGGQRRQENLQQFFSLAADSGNQTTLMAFLSDLDQRMRHGQSIPCGEQSSGAAVRIMSIHKSKGLEFPIVILADLSRRFNTEDLRSNVMTHPTLLLGSNVLDQQNRVRYPTIARKAIAMQLRQESISEELRVLYVAMTRAKERLIMTYCSKYLETELANVAAAADRPVSPQFAGTVKNPGMWVLAAAMTRSEAGELFAVGGYPRQAQVSDIPWTIGCHSPETLGETAAVNVVEEPASAVHPLPGSEDLSDTLEYQYPFAAAAAVPSKVTATQLKGRPLDQEVTEQAENFLPISHRKLRQPNFVTANRGLSPTERGTANHLFLQFSDYAACQTPEGVAAELQRMLRQEFLTPEQADAVSVEHMVQLFQSALGQQILNCPQVVREMKFSLLVDGAIYDPTAAGEQVMLQGVIDCMLLEKDGITVIDFKTDRVQPGQEADRAAVYARQLQTYAMAISRIYQIPVRRKILYFLTTGQMQEITE